MANNSSNSFYIFIYVVSSLAFFMAVLMKTYFFVHLTLKSSSQLHDKVFERVSRASMAFFDTTPTGRILNRFSKDLDEIDIQLPFNLQASAQNLIRILISVAVIAVVFPWFLIGLFPLFILFLLITRVFNRSVRQLKRMDGVTRSPLYSHLSATVQGLSTLHAYNKMADFNEVFKKYLDLNTRPFFMFYCSNRWLAVRLDMLTVCIVTLAAFMVVLIKGTLPPAFLGLVLTYSLKVRFCLFKTNTMLTRVRLSLQTRTNLVGSLTHTHIICLLSLHKRIMANVYIDLFFVFCSSELTQGKRGRGFGGQFH